MLSHELVSVVFDDGIDEKFLAYPLYLLAHPDRIGFSQVDLNVFALPDVVHAGEAQAPQCVLNGLALWVEDTRLERDPNARLHEVPGGWFARQSPQLRRSAAAAVRWSMVSPKFFSPRAP